MPRPTVVVTRPAGQSRQLTEALQAAGLDVLSFPLLAIGPAADDAPLRAALARRAAAAGPAADLAAADALGQACARELLAQGADAILAALADPAAASPGTPGTQPPA
ncbi:Porphobilinogen deaminase (fragment) [Cupriavidus oxalaticus]|uniref:Porphobilinogen deaminase n=1 Tax=Cupriavidus oxalaticus TaxID=96344 RepID=A0A375G5R8_9BURK